MIVERVDFHYDAAGRLYKTSLPYLSSSQSFNYNDEQTSVSRDFAVTYFDEIGRVYRTEAAADDSDVYTIYGKDYKATIDAKGYVTATEINVSVKSYPSLA